jgi:hypothetical protein
MKHDRAPKDPMGGHMRIYWSIVDSPAWRVLSHADVRVYLALRRKLRSTNNGDINATLAEMRHSGISSSSTLSMALHRLEVLGFIAKTRQGGIAFGGKLCSLYRFTDQPTYEMPKLGLPAVRATSDWQRFTTIAAARAEVAKTTPQKKNAPRRSKQLASTIKPEGRFSDSTIEAVHTSPIRLSKQQKTAQIAPQAA